MGETKLARPPFNQAEPVEVHQREHPKKKKRKERKDLNRRENLHSISENEKKKKRPGSL